MSQKIKLLLLALSGLFLANKTLPVSAQISPDNSTNTIVNPIANTIDIDGGITNQNNLFHSFSEFNLNQGEIANFLSNPNIQNILGRITGTNPSFINGVIQVTGGNSNLFLMNPAGIIFGQNAILNVPANFSATTATGIGFDNGIFNAIGSNNFSNLTGNPSSFIFNTNNPGSIVNVSNNSGITGDFNLVGGNVINSQTITTPQGKINIVALDQAGRVRITPQGSLLSIELNIPSDERGNLLGFTPKDLPALLTGKNLGIQTTENNAVGINTITVAGVGQTKGSLEGNIITGNLISNGEDINLLSQGGGIVTGDINTSSALQGGFINVNSSEYVVLKNINSSSVNQAGNVSIVARDAINILRYENGQINNQSNANDFIVGIQLDSIDARSSQNVGGQVNLFSQSIIRAFNGLPRNNLLNLDANDNLTISSRGAISGDSVTISYKINDILNGFFDQEAFRIPFQVGESTTTFTLFEDLDNSSEIILGNGTEKGIETGERILTEGSFTYNETIGNVAIISDPAPPDVVERKRIEQLVQQAKQNKDLVENIEPTVGEVSEQPANTTDVVVNSISAPNAFTTNININTVSGAQNIINQISQVSDVKPALIYVSFSPQGYQPNDLEAEFVKRETSTTLEYQQLQDGAEGAPQTNDSDQLDILIVTGEGQPIRTTVPVTRGEVVEATTNLWANISDPFLLDDGYKGDASQLYDWLIKPIESALQAQGINNLLFVMPESLRFLPLAALYDQKNKQFLVEKYSSGLAPSLNLNDSNYTNPKDLNLLAMGASTFADSGVQPLPAAGIELPTLQKVWGNNVAVENNLNENFTLDNVLRQVQSKSFGIVHFATHGKFNPSAEDSSYIQLYDSVLPLDGLRRLDLGASSVELLVLSACETAFGNGEAELGFAGLAVQTGVKSALGSVWEVSDTGTLALMTNFYAQLKQQSTKAEALRQAQLSLLQKRTQKSPTGDTIITPDIEISLQDLPSRSQQPEDFSHPFYWAPFTMIGNPW